ncbi:lysis system i-spanin subunit Rz [Stenotrophomonas sp. GD03819]|uniref:lysis system i-spanin subunit Rz n=1 Tax=Stenotrophomonas sp. GD03819 TaxID=2975384 RepID=UPI00244D1947|nr:lysis system i-spanin subunit Rz [Stenotrophomonas sp. GD03819]MDH1792387.1 lysis system i-spanin subunit Rz [Stenotrophomonas sp. GD03819]HDS1834892.1 lysis protein [Stenotrophomonas maltophilia]
MVRTLTATAALLLVLLLVAIAAALLYRGNALDAQARDTRAQQRVTTLQSQLESERSARTTEHTQATEMAKIGDDHEDDREASASIPAAVVADLRAGNLQLRDDLATCHTARLSQAVSGAVERDESAQLRTEVAGDLVQVGRDANNHVQACQRVIGVLTGQRPLVETTP